MTARQAVESTLLMLCICAASPLLSSCAQEKSVPTGPPRRQGPAPAPQTSGPKPPGGTPGKPDPATTDKVKKALQATQMPMSWQTVEVETLGNVVHLKGTVPDEQQKVLAERIARQSAGVRFLVENELKVGGEAKKPAP